MTMTDDQAKDQKPEAKQEPEQDKRRVLMLLEDDFALRSLLQVMFEQWGFKALAFPDGFRAAAWIDQVEAGDFKDPLPELALLDIRVPGPLGTEIAHRMRITASTSKIRIVIMTAYRMDSVETDALLKAINPDGFLHKGDMDFEGLHKQLMEILDTPGNEAVSVAKPAESPAVPTTPTTVLTAPAADPQPAPGKDEVPGKV
jgi:CheY-like chemotaxis protein